jgi:hypothetical protein
VAGGHGAAALAPAVRICGGGRRRLIGKSRKCDPGHGFISGLAWEKESKEGNAFRGLCDTQVLGIDTH